MHMYDVDAVQWLREKMEKPGAMVIPDVQKKDIMRRLTKAVLLVCIFIIFIYFSTIKQTIR